MLYEMEFADFSQSVHHQT